MEYLTNPVQYLETSDINSDGSVKTNESVIIMIQGNFCGFCTQAKPAFLKAAKIMNGKVLFCTVQIDGENKDVMQKLEKSLINYRGVPHYHCINADGTCKTHEGDRTTESLVQTAKSL